MEQLQILIANIKVALINKKKTLPTKVTVNKITNPSKFHHKDTSMPTESRIIIMQSEHVEQKKIQRIG